MAEAFVKTFKRDYANCAPASPPGGGNVALAMRTTWLGPAEKSASVVSEPRPHTSGSPRVGPCKAGECLRTPQRRNGNDVEHPAHLDQLLPVAAVAGEARDFAGGNRAHFAEADFRDHPLEAGAHDTAGGGATEIVVNDFDLGPAAHGKTQASLICSRDIFSHRRGVPRWRAPSDITRGGRKTRDVVMQESEKREGQFEEETSTCDPWRAHAAGRNADDRPSAGARSTRSP
jgi:hypothetical protein